MGTLEVGCRIYARGGGSQRPGFAYGPQEFARRIANGIRAAFFVLALFHVYSIGAQAYIVPSSKTPAGADFRVVQAMIPGAFDVRRYVSEYGFSGEFTDLKTFSLAIFTLDDGDASTDDIPYRLSLSNLVKYREYDGPEPTGGDWSFSLSYPVGQGQEAESLDSIRQGYLADLLRQSGIVRIGTRQAGGATVLRIEMDQGVTVMRITNIILDAISGDTLGRQQDFVDAVVLDKGVELPKNTSYVIVFKDPSEDEGSTTHRLTIAAVYDDNDDYEWQSETL